MHAFQLKYNDPIGSEYNDIIHEGLMNDSISEFSDDSKSFSLSGNPKSFTLQFYIDTNGMISSIDNYDVNEFTSLDCEHEEHNPKTTSQLYDVCSLIYGNYTPVKLVRSTRQELMIVRVVKILMTQQFPYNPKLLEHVATMQVKTPVYKYFGDLMYLHDGDDLKVSGDFMLTAFDSHLIKRFWERCDYFPPHLLRYVANNIFNLIEDDIIPRFSESDLFDCYALFVAKLSTTRFYCGYNGICFHGKTIDNLSNDEYFTMVNAMSIPALSPTEVYFNIGRCMREQVISEIYHRLDMIAKNDKKFIVIPATGIYPTEGSFKIIMRLFFFTTFM